MSLAVFRAMWLGLLRDRGALAMGFLLPGLFFLIFATIFAGAGGEQMQLQLAVADEVRSDVSTRLVEALGRDGSLLLTGGDSLSAEDVRRRVRQGTADVGLIVRRDAEPLDSLGGFGAAPLLLVTDPVRGVAAPMVAGQVQKAYFAALPDVALRSVIGLLEDEFLELNDEQQDDIDAGLADLRDEAEEAIAAGRSTGWGFQELFEREDVSGVSAVRHHVAYYAGAVAVLFLLFSAVHGAISLLEERDGGILDRVLAGPGRIGVLIDGKFLFLVLQGFVQITVIFVVAALVYGVDLVTHLGPWAVTTLVASAAAAGLAMSLAAACRPRRQAQTLANVAILVLSAIGGSMVPRFFMPGWLQDLGWLTPNTWALEAYTSIFWREETLSALWMPWSALLLAALAGWWFSRRLARRLEVM